MRKINDIFQFICLTHKISSTSKSSRYGFWLYFSLLFHFVFCYSVVVIYRYFSLALAVETTENGFREQKPREFQPVERFFSFSFGFLLKFEILPLFISFTSDGSSPTSFLFLFTFLLFLRHHHQHLRCVVCIFLTSQIYLKQVM